MMNQNQIIPRKGDVIISPKTNRPIRVGSTAWRGLAREGLVPNYYTDPKVLCNTQTEEEVETKINELNQTLPYTHQAVRGRGHYKNQIVSRVKQPGVEVITKATAKKASKLMKEKSNELEDMDEEELERELEKLILGEIVKKKSKPIGITNKKVSLTPVNPSGRRGRPAKNFSLRCDSSEFETTDLETTEVESSQVESDGNDY